MTPVTVVPEGGDQGVWLIPSSPRIDLERTFGWLGDGVRQPQRHGTSIFHPPRLWLV